MARQQQKEDRSTEEDSVYKREVTYGGGKESKREFVQSYGKR